MARAGKKEFGKYYTPYDFFFCRCRIEHYDTIDTFSTHEPVIMAFVPHPAVMVNLLLCVVILVLGYLVYQK
jgi:hypothetical protein